MLILTTFLAALALHAAQPSGGQTMKAIRFHEHGGREVLKYEDARRPTPAEDELLVRVIAAGVNPVDALIRRGGRRAQLPFTPGHDLAGIVESVGPGVTTFRPGDDVYACLPLDRGGAYAEFAIVREEEAAPKPQTASFAEAAAVGVAALTAWQAFFDTADLQPGQTVLIHGGSGGVGTMAIQLAKWKGARVIATASTRNQDYLKELGADVAIDYTTQRFEDIAKDVDVVLDAVGGETRDRSIPTLKQGGILITIAGPPVPQDAARNAGIRATGMLVKRSGEQLRKIAELIDSGDLKIVVSQELPLSKAAKAHEQIETKHTRGKIVLKVAEPPAPQNTSP
jgi:NADPH:quinone reductase-like Zn-dependent oxidoreductase